MNLKELRVRARELDIPGRSAMNKADLEAMIADAEGRNVPPLVEYGTAVTVGPNTRTYEEKATAALEAVVGITMDTLRGESPFDPPEDEATEICLTGPGLGALAEMLDLNVEVDPEGTQEFVNLMQGVVDKGIQQKRSKATSRRRRARIQKRGY